MPEVSSNPVGVVTVTHNTGDTLRTFLESLRAASSNPLEIVVVDNASSDAPTVRAIAESFGARFVALDTNVGYGAGVDAGIAQLRTATEYALISNPDVQLMPDAIDILVEHGERSPGAATLGPRINDASGALYPSARRLPSLRTGIGHALFVRVWPSNPWSRSYREERTILQDREAGWLSGACMLVRLRDFRAINGFDKSYFMYFEDVDLGARMTKAGKSNLYVPSAVAVHTGAHSTSSDPRAMDRVHHLSAYQYLSRKYSAWYLFPLRVALRVGLGVRSWFRARR